MTIPRVLLFAALLVLGFMIWGIHQDVFTLTQEARGLKDVVIRQPSPQPMKVVPLPRPRPKHKFHRPVRRKAVIHPKRESPVRFISPVQGDTSDDTVICTLPVPLTD